MPLIDILDTDAGPDIRPRILLIGTFDTKKSELGRTAELIERLGGEVVTLDSSVSGAPAETAVDEPAEVIASKAGTSLSGLADLPRGEAVAAMQRGVTARVVELVEEGGVHGALCIGGAGAHLVGPAFQELPIGFPKMIVTPLASGSRVFEPFTGLRDVTVMHSVADVAGINPLIDVVYAQAAGYIVGAVRGVIEAHRAAEGGGGRPLVAASMNGNTTAAVTRARELLEDAGYEMVAFHANGAGGRAMESLMAGGTFAAVFDFTTTELCARVLGGLMDPGPDRMEVAGSLGLPQVLVPGCVDFITTGRYEVAEKEYPGRKLFRHNPELTLVRLAGDEMGEMGDLFARKASSATGPTSVVVPTQGFSVPDSIDDVFWDPEADLEFVNALQANLSPDVGLKLIDAHINDPEFVDVAVEELLSLNESRQQSVPTTGGISN